MLGKAKDFPIFSDCRIIDRIAEVKGAVGERNLDFLTPSEFPVKISIFTHRLPRNSGYPADFRGIPFFFYSFTFYSDSRILPRRIRRIR